MRNQRRNETELRTCPFCGNNRICVSTRGWQEAFFWSWHIRKPSEQEREKAFSYVVYCGLCGASVMRGAVGQVVKAAVRRLVIRRWNTRIPTDTLVLPVRGRFLPCPCCRSSDVDCSLAPMSLISGKPPALVDVVHCLACGLRLVPYRVGEMIVRMESGVRSRPQLAEAWNRRQAHEDWIMEDVLRPRKTMVFGFRVTEEGFQILDGSVTGIGPTIPFPDPSMEQGGDQSLLEDLDDEEDEEC